MRCRLSIQDAITTLYLSQIQEMFHRLYYHIVWTTRDRRSDISRDIAEFLERVLRSIAEQERAQVLELGMVTTHLHLLVRAHPMTSIPRLLQRLKGASAALAGRELNLPTDRQLRWAAGCTIQSVSPGQLENVARYVRNQPERHPHDVIPGWSPVRATPEPVGPMIDDSLACIERMKEL